MEEFLMGSNLSSARSGISPRLSGISQKLAIVLWGLISITSLLSLSFSIYSLNLWDRIPAAESTRYFSDMTPTDVQIHANWQNTVLRAGFSLSGYALIFTLARIISGVSLFVVGFMLIRRYHDHLMAVLMATLLSVFAAAGIWSNPLFGWGESLAPWLSYPVQVLGWLVWCGAIMSYTFPDGKFTPRWTIWLTVLLVPLTFILSFSIDIFLNPDNWPGPLYLLPNIIFVGGALFAVIYRYTRVVEPEKKQALCWYVWGISLLMIVYFVNLFLMEGYYWITGHFLLQSPGANLTYVLVNEPIWFACETFFAVGLALSVFRDKLLEK
jgi:hypothetical protein